MSFAAWIRETRLRKGLQVSECAVRAGVGQPTWSDYEASSPNKEWRKATIHKIALGLGVDSATALVEARLLPLEEPDMEAGRRLGPILARASPSKRRAILDMLEEVASGMVKIAAA